MICSVILLSHDTARFLALGYNTLINAFGQRGKAKKALGVLNQMDQFSSKSGGVVADERTFNAIIHVLSTSNLKGKMILFYYLVEAAGINNANTK